MKCLGTDACQCNNKDCQKRRNRGVDITIPAEQVCTGRSGCNCLRCFSLLGKPVNDEGDRKPLNEAYRLKKISDHQKNLELVEDEFKKKSKGKCPKQEMKLYTPLAVFTAGESRFEYKASLKPDKGSTSTESGPTYLFKRYSKSDPEGKAKVRFEEEKKFLIGFKSPFIQTLFACSEDTGYNYLIMEYPIYGDLEAVRTSFPERKLPEERAQAFFRQVLLGLQYMHACQIVHRDINPLSIFIFEGGRAKIGNFAKALRMTAEHYPSQGTKEYLPPEILRNTAYSDAVDWWAFAITLCEVVTGSHPFGHSTRVADNVACDDFDCRIPEVGISLELQDFLRKLLDKNQSSRLGTNKEGVLGIQSHPWLKDTDWYEVLFFRRQCLMNDVRKWGES